MSHYSFRMLLFLKVLCLVMYLAIKKVNAAGSSPSSTASTSLNSYYCSNGNPYAESWTNGSPVTSIEIYTVDIAKTQIYAFRVNG